MANGSFAYKKPDACAFVIFGVTGDLTHRLVLPSLYNLAASNLLPDRFCIVGITRKEASSEKLREDLLKGLRRYATRPVEDEVAKRLLQCVTAIEADPREPESFDQLKMRLEKLEANRETGGNRLFYLATPPSAFAPIAQQLGRVGLLQEDGDGSPWRRLVVEKPFGTDLASAKVLNDKLLKILNEHQIYRIDHYLGKETVQNILVLRFANGMLEPIWNRHHIDHVQITVHEKLSVGTRGSFYDATGALRDMVPNHLFQLLSLVGMEPPARFDAHTVRSEKAEVLAAIQIQSEDEALRNSVRGQYTAGRIGDTDLPDYRSTEDVRPDSATETYAALKLTIDNWRWAGVPFYLRTGKALDQKRTEVAIKFRQAPFAMFTCTPVESLAENYLVIAIEPTQGITLQFNTKVPGPTIRTEGVQMKFNYKDYFKAEPATGYETLIYDCMIGDNMLFQRADSVEAGWKAVQPFIDAWKKAGREGLQTYAAGSEGPEAAAELLIRDGRSWRKPG
ncbi:glucose-6-phosphate dehydrogenase [Bradyrhizobium sp. STM 3557]|uniref:glucose-6-phosphate dehydrogenase n=1 Tax=Bradyrhizobium sp. STM 3557 TaxID=578920 RepID=UPI00388F5151